MKHHFLSSGFIFSRLALFIFIVVGFSSCIDRQVLPPSIGSIGQVTVLVDEYTWDSPIQDTFVHLYESPYLLLPAPEPIFDINAYPYEDFVAARRQLRYIIFLGDLSVRSTTNDQIRLALGEENYNRALNDPTYYSAVSKDRWANGQTVYFVFGNNREELARNITRTFPIISRQIMESDRPKIRARTYLLGTSNSLTQKVQENFNLEMRVPGGYMVALEKDNLLWLRKRAGNTTFGIFIHEEPYTDQEQVSSQNLKAIRDTLGKRYVQSEMEGAYMQINDIDLPVIYATTTLDGAYAIEARGIWEMEGDFFGGPFISYLLLDEQNSRIIFLDGFVLAPGIPKRVLMQELEYIISNVRLLD